MMTLTGMAALLIAVSCSRKVNSVPSVVQNTLQVSYPQAQDIDWDKAGKVYEAEFVAQGKDIAVLINDSGKVLKQKEDILPAEVPATVLNTLKTAYANYTIDDAEKVSSNGATYYQLDLEAQAKRDVQLVMNADGKQAQGQVYWD